MGVTLAFVAAHRQASVPGITVVVPGHSIIFVATHHLATVPGVAAVIVASPWMELVVAFPVVDEVHTI